MGNEKQHPPGPGRGRTGEPITEAEALSIRIQGSPRPDIRPRYCVVCHQHRDRTRLVATYRQGWDQPARSPVAMCGECIGRLLDLFGIARTSIVRHRQERRKGLHRKVHAPEEENTND